MNSCRQIIPFKGQCSFEQFLTKLNGFKAS